MQLPSRPSAAIGSKMGILLSPCVSTSSSSKRSSPRENSARKIFMSAYMKLERAISSPRRTAGGGSPRRAASRSTVRSAPRRTASDTFQMSAFTATILALCSSFGQRFLPKTGSTRDGPTSSRALCRKPPCKGSCTSRVCRTPGQVFLTRQAGLCSARARRTVSFIAAWRAAAKPGMSRTITKP